ncbi:hypothetical protein [Hyphococcus sp.]|uniref:hypothetical protein n=1 Tax=Hyphococcus sp. TaxID=2038636 RepID=UPI0035C6E3BC
MGSLENLFGSPILIALTGSIAGFIASNGAQWFHDARKQRFEREAITSAVISEIEYLVEIIESRPFAQLMNKEAALLESEVIKRLTRPTIVILPELPDQEPIFESQLSRLGLIDKNIVAKIVKFHRLLFILKADQKSLHKYNPKAQISALKYHVYLLEKIVRTGKEIISEKGGPASRAG